MIDEVVLNQDHTYSMSQCGPKLRFPLSSHDSRENEERKNAVMGNYSDYTFHTEEQMMHQSPGKKITQQIE